MIAGNKAFAKSPATCLALPGVRHTVSLPQQMLLDHGAPGMRAHMFAHIGVLKIVDNLSCMVRGRGGMSAWTSLLPTKRFAVGKQNALESTMPHPVQSLNATATPVAFDTRHLLLAALVLLVSWTSSLAC